MNENEIMVQENEEVMPTVYEPETTEENSGMGTGAAVLLGSVLTLGAIAGAKLLKKAYRYAKSKHAKKTQPEVIDVEPNEPELTVEEEESEEEAK